MQREDSVEKVGSPAVVGSSCDGGSWETPRALASVPMLPVECSSCWVDGDSCAVVK